MYFWRRKCYCTSRDIYFHETYMTGKGYCIENDNTNSGLKKNDSTYFNAVSWLEQICRSRSCTQTSSYLSSLYQSGSFKFNILLHEVRQYKSIHLKGPLLNLFGLDSSRKMIITVGEPFSVQLLMFGHDYICVGSNVCSNIQAIQAGR